MITVGSRLKEERIKKNLSLEKISKATKIKSAFLEDIESGNYSKLPDGYVIGFVRNYAKFLRLPEKEITALLRREFDEGKKESVLPEGFIENRIGVRFKLGRSILLAGIAFLFLGFFIVYQYRAAIFNPPLNIYKPMENSVISSSTVEIVGKTDPDSTVSIGHETASVDNEGNFRKEIVLFPGKTSIKIEVENRFGRKTEIVRHIDVKATY